MAKLVLAGYFGAGNLGDDAILMGFANAIETRGHGFQVIAKSPELLMRNLGIRGLLRSDLGEIREALQSSDALVFPGGSIFQDVTSVKSVAYYANLVAMAKKANKKVILLGQGVGPLNRWLGKRFAVRAFNSADAIAVRDPGSAQTLKSLGVRVNPRLTGDLAYLLPKPPPATNTAGFGVAGMKTIAVNARPFGNDKGRGVVTLFSGLVRKLYAANYVPVMLEMDAAEDRPIIEAISKENGGKVPEIKGLTSPRQLQERIARVEAVIAMRLHAGILATTVGIPPYMVSYDPKVAAFSNALGFSAPPSIQGLTVERVFDGFQSFIKEKERTAASLERKVSELAQSALLNIDVLEETLRR
ncbi:MAG: polysaccharide pyruvyl transferase CsaB [Fimbriimonadaceae bacterium]|nr:polysaccharide pyruvyl transferase CsaB [Fimbriimonadaceae bacterium]